MLAMAFAATTTSPKSSYVAAGMRSQLGRVLINAQIAAGYALTLRLRYGYRNRYGTIRRAI
jgi:hypothetical protein